MVKVPYITAHDLIRLDKAVRTLQLRFLIRRRQRLVKNVGTAQRRLINNNNQTTKPPRNCTMDSSIGENDDLDYSRGKLTKMFTSDRNNANGHDASINDTTFDEVSFNESSVASNDLTMEHNNEKVKKTKGGRSFMRKLGGLFSSEKVCSFCWYDSFNSYLSIGCQRDNR